MTNEPIGTLFQEIVTTYNDAKKEYPHESFVAVEYDNVLYFLHDDAEIVSDIFSRKLYHFAGIPCAVVDKHDYNKLSIALHENNLLMVIVEKADSISDQLSRKLESILNMYHEIYLQGLNIKEIGDSI